MAIAIVSAMQEERQALLAHLGLPQGQSASVSRIAGRDFHEVKLAGQDVVLTLSGIGKVAAAATTAVLLQRFPDVAVVLFTGVAGGLAKGVTVGDVVIAQELLQHDLDVSPLFPRYEVPHAGRSRFTTDPSWSQRLAVTARGLGLQVHEGLVISGDRFVATAAESAELTARLPDALAVEMEGAAVAQVCTEFNVPFAVLRTISDRADDSAHGDFLRFVSDVAADVSHKVVLGALAS